MFIRLSRRAAVLQLAFRVAISSDCPGGNAPGPCSSETGITRPDFGSQFLLTLSRAAPAGTATRSATSTPLNTAARTAEAQVLTDDP